MTKQQFEQMLNETRDEITLFGITFQAGTALRKLDPIAFDVLFNSIKEDVN